MASLLTSNCCGRIKHDYLGLNCIIQYLLFEGKIMVLTSVLLCITFLFHAAQGRNCKSTVFPKKTDKLSSCLLVVLRGFFP